MKYLGGKSKIARWLAAAIRPVRAGRPFWDPFCGGLSCSVELAQDGPGVVTDANLALVSTYLAIAGGWAPPDTVTEDEYRAARDLPDADPLKAFAGFGCSFAGKWFGGYARAPGSDRSFAGESARALLRDVGALVASGCEIGHADFLACEPRETSAVLYLDPPYAGTEPYAGTRPFDHAVFYDRVRAWSRFTDVFVSEYEMPWGRPVLEFSHGMSVAEASHRNTRRERLYHYGPSTC